jgi:hypothetical protein
MMERRAKGVEVALRFSDAFVLFWRRISFGTDHSAAGAYQAARDAEVDQHDPILGGDHHVGRFHVTEDDRFRLLTMQVGEHLAQLNRPARHTLFGQRTPCLAEDSFQVFSVDQLQDQIDPSILLEEIEDFWNGGMLQRCQQPGFALEVLEIQQARIRIRRTLIHLLDRARTHDILEAQVAPAIHNAHPADTQRAFDDIAPLQDHTGLHHRRNDARASAGGCRSLRVSSGITL